MKFLILLNVLLKALEDYMIKNKFTKCTLGVMLAASVLLSGCGKSAETSDNNTKTVKSVRLETGDITQNSVVMKIGNTGVKYEEVLNYAYLLKNQYEGSFGKALWSYKIDDDTNIGDKAKKEIVSMITQLKIIGENAAKQGITLDGDEKDQALQDAQKLVNKADKKEKKKYALTVQNVQRMFEDNILANKMFYVATDAADTNVTDDEAKQIKIQYLELITKGTDKNGRKINMGVQIRRKHINALKKCLKKPKNQKVFWIMQKQILTAAQVRQQ